MKASRQKAMHPLQKGVVTGLFLQLAIGPVFFFVSGIALTSTYLNSLAAILAVTTADYCYISLSLFGIGRVVKHTRWQGPLTLTSTLVLIIFGLVLCYQGSGLLSQPGTDSLLLWTPLRSFSSALILTVSSPLTIVFWGSVFSAKAIEHRYGKRQLVWFGVGAGLATPIFLSAAMLALSFNKAHVPAVVWQITNCLVGLALIYYGISTAIHFFRPVRK